MTGRGEAILEYLVKRADGAQSVGVIAREIGYPDGRGIARLMEKMVEAKILVRTTGKDGLYYPTARGRELDAILDRITASRGGEFVPTLHAGVTSHESYVLRYYRR